GVAEGVHHQMHGVAERVHCDRDHSLYNELHMRVSAASVVVQAEQRDGDTANEQPDYSVLIREEEVGDVVLPEEEAKQRHDERNDDGDTTHTWDRLRMDLP